LPSKWSHSCCQANASKSFAIEVTYYDRYGKQITTIANDLDALAWQHECEHLEGKVYIDNLDYMQRKKFEKEYAKAMKQKRKAK